MGARGRQESDDDLEDDVLEEEVVPRSKCRRHRHRILRVALLGGAVALVGSERLRNRALDLVFGPEEEFEYESQTEPASFAGFGGTGSPSATADDEIDTAWADAP